MGLTAEQIRKEMVLNGGVLFTGQSKVIPYGFVDLPAIVYGGPVGFNEATGLEDFEMSAGTLVNTIGPNGQPAVTFNGTQRIWDADGSLTGAPFDVIDDTTVFSVSMFVKSSSVSSNHIVFANGKGTANEAGMRLNYAATSGQIRLEVADGTGNVSMTSIADGHGWTFEEWSHIAFTVDFSTETIKFWTNGMFLGTTGQDLKDFSGTLTYPITPARPFIFGSSDQGSQSVAFVGSLSQFILVPQYSWTDDDLRLLCNFGVGRPSWADIKQASNIQFLQSARSTFPTSTSFRVSARLNSQKPVTVVCYEDGGDGGTAVNIVSGTRGPVVARVNDVMPNNYGYAHCVFDNLPPATTPTKWHVAFEDDQGREDSIELRAWTTPTNNTFDVAVLGCTNYNYTGTHPVNLTRGVLSQCGKFLVHLGDEGYYDIVAPPSTEYEFANSVDAIALGDYSWQYLYSRMTMIPGFSDHDLAGEDNGDMDSALIDFGRQLYIMKNNPDLTKFPGYDDFTTPHLLYYHDLSPDIRIICLDERSTFDPGVEVINALQLAQFDAICRESDDLEKAVVLMGDRPWYLNDTPTDELWETTPANRTAVFDAILDTANANAKTIDNQIIHLKGDVHSQGIDDGDIQVAPYGTGGSTAALAIIAGRASHASAGTIQVDECAHYFSGGLNGWVKVSFDVNAGDIRATARAYLGSTAQGTSLAYTMDNVD